MNAIEAMQAEIEYQVQELYEPGLSSSPCPPPPRSNDCMFVGSGDSYVAGLVAQYLSGTRSICFYPVDIIKNPSLVKDRNLYIVSISGNTQANILAAQIAKKNGANTVTAITARSSSRLAKSCDQTIKLRYRNTGTITSGTISFTASMIKCILLSTGLQPVHTDLRKIYNDAQEQVEQALSMFDQKRGSGNFTIGNNSISNSSSYFLLGDSHLYAIAKYGALKFNEVFGARAFAYPAEEFCHSPLFSFKESDHAIVLGDSNGSNNRKLSKRLNEEGFSSFHVEFKNAGIELLLQATFFLQVLVLKQAQKNGLTSCHFLMDKKLLKMSSDFIYPPR
ncbi:MAG: SIS domain-containing protein [Thermoproteota archaeon]|nr:SIS domain-containing protein [Thermoproteota archaeon]